MKTVRKPLYTQSAAVFPWDEKLAKQFEFTNRFDELVRLWEQFGDYLYLPRNCAPISDDDSRDEGRNVKFALNFTPRKDQGRVVAESVELLREGTSHIVQAPTGYGKTYVGAAIAAHIGKRTMVLTTKEDIIEQWVNAFVNVCGVSEDDIGVWRGDSVPDASYPVVVGLVQSAMKGYDRYGPTPYSEFGLVISDEVHRMGADQFSNAMWYFSAKLRLGLSATPYRKDGRDPVFHGHIGPVRVSTQMETMIPRIIMQRTKWRVPRVMRRGSVIPLPHQHGKTMHLNKSLAEDTGRNSSIAKFTHSAYKKNRNTIIFADTMDHLHAIREALVLEGISEKVIGYYVGLQFYKGKDKKEQRDKVKSLPIILATYKMVSEATDIPWLDTAVLASPRADVVQIVGRIRREYPDKKTPVVFDLVDDNSNVFRDYAHARAKWYSKLGAEVKHL